MLKGKYHRSLDKCCLFVAASIDQRTKCEKTAPMTRMLTRFIESVADVTGDMEQQA